VVDRLDHVYWAQGFAVAEIDLDGIASHIEVTVRAQDLTSLAKRVVKGRLSSGREGDGGPLALASGHPSVRLWDPAGEWRQGDRVIVARLLPGRVHRASVGTVLRIHSGHVEFELDESGDLVRFVVARPDSKDARKWRAFVSRVVDETLASPAVDMQAEGILLRHGENVLSRLLHSLASDGRFVEVRRRWFLTRLASLPADDQVSRLAWAMVGADRPQETGDLVPLVEPPLARGDRGLFGLYLALAARPNAFERVESEQDRGWILCGPPPGCFTPNHAAYDPATFEVLCVPGERAGERVVRRLWELDLLSSAV
jgi:hypothetical protein